ncbi:transcription elongation factor GreA [Candidatus Woesebacteria bacterium]|nr:transcription elongation factor GreA [Candidatus Woesebacteria bacterium]|tara:strand:+ start:210 stop:689 length:480 start_codon:yes stop_codon:yes gene_type:complete
MINKPNNNEKVQLTQEGFQGLTNELKELNEKRPAAVDRLANARAMGDLSENNDYHNSREALEFLDGRITELEKVLQAAEVVKNSSGKQTTVGVGTTVRVGTNGKQHSFHIVGEWEADPKEKKISHESPLGQALVGKKVGDKVEVEAPAGKIMYSVLGIE